MKRRYVYLVQVRTCDENGNLDPASGVFSAFSSQRRAFDEAIHYAWLADEEQPTTPTVLVRQGDGLVFVEATPAVLAKELKRISSVLVHAGSSFRGTKEVWSIDRVRLD